VCSLLALPLQRQTMVGGELQAVQPDRCRGAGEAQPGRPEHACPAEPGCGPWVREVMRVAHKRPWGRVGRGGGVLNFGETPASLCLPREAGCALTAGFDRHSFVKRAQLRACALLFLHSPLHVFNLHVESKRR